MQLYRFTRKIEVLVPAETDTAAAETEADLMAHVRSTLSECSKSRKFPVLSALLSDQGRSHMLPITGDTAKLMKIRQSADLFGGSTKAQKKTAAKRKSGSKVAKRKVGPKK